MRTMNIFVSMAYPTIDCYPSAECFPINRGEAGGGPCATILTV